MPTFAVSPDVIVYPPSGSERAVRLSMRLELPPKPVLFVAGRISASGLSATAAGGLTHSECCRLGGWAPGVSPAPRWLSVVVFIDCDRIVESDCDRVPTVVCHRQQLIDRCDGVLVDSGTACSGLGDVDCNRSTGRVINIRTAVCAGCESDQRACVATGGHTHRSICVNSGERAGAPNDTGTGSEGTNTSEKRPPCESHVSAHRQTKHFVCWCVKWVQALPDRCQRAQPH